MKGVLKWWLCKISGEWLRLKSNDQTKVYRISNHNRTAEAFFAFCRSACYLLVFLSKPIINTKTYHVRNHVLVGWVQHLGSHQKHILHIFTRFCRCLHKVSYFKFPFKLFSLFSWNLPGCLSVLHISDEDHHYIGFALLFSLADPSL